MSGVAGVSGAGVGVGVGLVAGGGAGGLGAKYVFINWPVALILVQLYSQNTKEAYLWAERCLSSSASRLSFSLWCWDLLECPLYPRFRFDSAALQTALDLCCIKMSCKLAVVSVPPASVDISASILALMSSQSCSTAETALSKLAFNLSPSSSSISSSLSSAMSFPESGIISQSESA
ncbi:hypothetical protein EDD18DRAFT_664492 [Armillaria luteobubalina]|uniref:Uncharacterized protein n=1 Tax=Armillaria luteobubalina TaxID=153913 RepID=A0AA39TFW1_9AGAR|nr:hypothetical protein EDD18DRAFT_664492 [Armillaria luteobubalina]